MKSTSCLLRSMPLVFAAFAACGETAPGVTDAGRETGADVTPLDVVGQDVVEAGSDVADAGPCPRGYALCEGLCVDVTRSALHCGRCGNSCLALPNVDDTVACIDGACAPARSCQAGWGSCMRAPSSGAPTASTPPENCGGCAVRCAGATPLCTRITGPDGRPRFACTAQCGPGGVLVDQRCVDTLADPENCGMVGRSCARPGTHTVALCEGGACGSRCAPGWSDCDGDGRGVDANGCESDLNASMTSCGRCGRACATGSRCVDGACRCTDGRTDCDGDGRCETDTATDRESCGVCGRRCPTNQSGGPVACVAGRCAVPCEYPSADCNAEGNGRCATNLTRDPLHCGACGRVCPPCPGGAPSCTLGQCACACAPGRADCDGRAATGCEAVPSGDALNCGRCGDRCSAVPNGRATCAAGSCDFVCDPGYQRAGTQCATWSGDARPPRPIAPLAGMVVSSARPVLRWARPADAAATWSGARVEICRRRACRAEDIEQVFVSEQPTSAVVPAPLAEGWHWWRVQSALGGRRAEQIGRDASPAWGFYVGRGEATGQSAWGGTADLDGDGFGEAVAGDPDGARVVLRESTGNGVTERPELRGPANSLFGWSLATCDVDGDGVQDLVVGAPRFTSATARGRVYVLYGGDGGVATPTEQNAATWRAEDADVEGFGRAVACAGDVNGDGFADIAVGAADATGPAALGRVFVLRGKSRDTLPLDRVELTPAAQPARWGASVAVLDFNNDGFSEVVVGHPGYSNNRGQAVMFFGCAQAFAGSNGCLAANAVAINGAGATAQMGELVASIGDVTHDGLADLLAVEPLANDGRGRATVFFGHAAPAPDLSNNSGELIPLAGESFGRRAAGGDFDGDGLGDVALTLFRRNTDGTEGVSYVRRFIGQPGSRVLPRAGDTCGEPGGARAMGLAVGAASLTGDLAGDDLLATGSTGNGGRALYLCPPQRTTPGDALATGTGEFGRCLP